jgi:hypothetical protein
MMIHLSTCVLVYFSSALCVISPLLAGKAGGLVNSVWICEWLAGRSKLHVDTQFQINFALSGSGVFFSPRGEVNE